jgi:polyisoprenoid-binding protein YceI
MLLAALTLNGALLGPQTTWSAPPGGSYVVVTIARLLGPPVRATLPVKTADVVARDDGIPLAVRVTLDSAALSSGDPGRDATLRSARFFNVARYPTIVFVGERAIPKTDGRFTVPGHLSLHGVTNPIAFDARLVELRNGVERRAHYTASARFRRSTYGMRYAELVVADTVALSVVLDVIADR